MASYFLSGRKCSAKRSLTAHEWRFLCCGILLDFAQVETKQLRLSVSLSDGSTLLPANPLGILHLHQIQGGRSAHPSKSSLTEPRNVGL